MTLIDFISEYPDEVSCKSKFKQYRDHVGVNATVKIIIGKETKTVMNVRNANIVKVFEPILSCTNLNCPFAIGSPFD